MEGSSYVDDYQQPNGDVSRTISFIQKREAQTEAESQEQKVPGIRIEGSVPLLAERQEGVAEPCSFLELLAS